MTESLALKKKNGIMEKWFSFGRIYREKWSELKAGEKMGSHSRTIYSIRENLNVLQSVWVLMNFSLNEYKIQLIAILMILSPDQTLLHLSSWTAKPLNLFNLCSYSLLILWFSVFRLNYIWLSLDQKIISRIKLFLISWNFAISNVVVFQLWINRCRKNSSIQVLFILL